MEDKIIFTILMILNFISAYKNWKLKTKWVMWLNISCVIGCLYFLLR